MSLKNVLVMSTVAAFTILSVVSAAQVSVERPGARQPRRLTKPRISPLPEAQWTDVHRQLVTKFSRDGRADNGLATLLHLPPLVEAVLPYTIYLSEESTLSPRHRELLVLRTAWLCGSDAIWSTHAGRARSAGLSAAEIRRVAQGPDAAGWDGFEATLLRFADQLYRNSSVNDTTWKALGASYDLFHLMDAVETVNHFTVLSLLYNSFGVQAERGASDTLPADVPYRINVPEREPPLAAARVDPIAGTGIAVGRTFARHARLNQSRGQRANFINRISKLMPRYREMLILRMGWNCRAEYEWAQHVGSVGRARDHGLDPVRIAQGADGPGWDPLERAILTASDELYRDAMVSDRTWTALAMNLDPGLVMTAIFTTSSYRATSMSLNAFGVQLEPGNERFPSLAAR